MSRLGSAAFQSGVSGIDGESLIETDASEYGAELREVSNLGLGGGTSARWRRSFFGIGARERGGETWS